MNKIDELVGDFIRGVESEIKTDTSMTVTEKETYVKLLRNKLGEWVSDLKYRKRLRRIDLLLGHFGYKEGDKGAYIVNALGDLTPNKMVEIDASNRHENNTGEDIMRFYIYIPQLGFGVSFDDLYTEDERPLKEYPLELIRFYDFKVEKVEMGFFNSLELDNDDVYTSTKYQI